MGNMLQVGIKFYLLFLFLVGNLTVKAFDVVAVNSVKQEIAVCGNNQVLYILNSEDLQVKNRISLDYQPTKNNSIFTYSKDGKYLIFEGLNNGLNFYETENYTFKIRIELFSKTYINNSKTSIATVDEANGFARVYSLPDGFTQDELYFEKGKFGSLLSCSYMNNESELVFCFESLKSSSDKINKPENWEQMTYLEQIEWEKKYDGLNSEFLTYKFKTKSWEKPKETWMNPNGKFNLFGYMNKLYGVDTRTIFTMDSLNEVKIIYADKMPIIHSSMDESNKLLVAITNLGVSFVDLKTNKVLSIPFNMQFQSVTNVELSDNWAYFVTSNFRLAAISTEAGKKGITHVY